MQIIFTCHQIPASRTAQFNHINKNMQTATTNDGPYASCVRSLHTAGAIGFSYQYSSIEDTAVKANDVSLYVIAGV